MCQTAFAWLHCVTNTSTEQTFWAVGRLALPWDYVRVARQPPNEPCDDQSKSSGWQQQTFSIA